MQIINANIGDSVRVGNMTGTFLRLSGPDAIVMLSDGRRVAWSISTEVEVLQNVEENQEIDRLPLYEAELARLLAFTEGKYAKLGIVADTPCTELPKLMHPPFIRVALGDQPTDAIVCRRCRSKLCVRPDHLFWGTRSDCQRDMVLRGVAKPGGKNVTSLEVGIAVMRVSKQIARVRAKC